MTIEFRAGQVWTYGAPEGFETSRIMIGAIVTFEDGERVVCCSVDSAPQRQPDGAYRPSAIAFLPMTESAFARSVDALEGEATAPAAFLAAYQVWKADPKGLSCFSVPFEGYLDRMIALQMAEIVGAVAA